MTVQRAVQSVADLASEAVTRRRFLSWMGVGAAAVASAPLLSACSNGSVAAGGPPEQKTLQFGIPDMPSQISGLQLSVQGTHYPLQVHTDQTRQAFAQSHPMGSQVDTSKLTHYVDNVSLPTTAPLEFSLWGMDSEAAKAGIPVKQPVQSGTDAFGQVPGSVYIGGGLNIPSWALKNVLDAASQVKPLNETYSNDQRLGAWGIKSAPTSTEQAASLFDLHYLPLSVAQKMVFKTPGVMNISSNGAAIVMSIIGSTDEVSGLTDAITWFHNNTGVYGITEPQIGDAAGSPIYVSPTGEPGNGAPQANVFNPFIQDGTTYVGHAIPVPRTTAFRESLRNAGLAVSSQCQDAVSLQRPSTPPPTDNPTSGPVTNYDGGNWVVSDGATPQTIDAKTAHEAAARLGLAAPSASASPSASSSAKSATPTPLPTLPPPQAGWTVSPDGFHHNLKVELNSEHPPAPIPSANGGGTTIPLRVYNNNERYFTVCGQNFQGGTQLSFGQSNHSSNDYTAAIGTSTTVMTIMGVPVFDTNWDDVVLTMLPDATHGRLLMAGAGSGTSWKQFFKDPDGNQLYSGCVLPGECSTPTLFTVLLNLAIPSIMLLSDAAGFSAVSKVGAKEISANEEVIGKALTVVLKSMATAQGLDGIVDIFLATPALDSSVSNWGATSPAQWAIPIAKIAMVLLAKGLTMVLDALLAAETASKVAEAVPIVGEAFAALSLAADAAALATATAEVTSSPMVTPYHVSASYTPMLTIEKDPRDSVFPRTATKWTLTPQIEGVGSLTSVENNSFSWQDTNITAAGQFWQPVPSVPVGARIRWIVSFQAANGKLVGVGASPWLDNSNIADLPQPTITIREIPYDLDSQSTFDLNATSEYVAGTGYQWSDQASIGGTVQDQSTVSGDAALTSAGSTTVGTVTGALGYVYQTSKGWRVNQLSVTSQPNTNAATTGRFYTSQPHLAYDSLGTVLTGGSNFLLEPWSKINGYLVRQLDLAQSDFGIKPVESAAITTHGRFFGELHGATYHPAGYLLAWNSDTCRIQTLRLPTVPAKLSANPSDNEICDVQTADFIAGKGNAQGNRPGLVQQPVGIAMGVNGIVLVLEQGTQRIQAFNTSGSPTPYFTPGGSSASYYLDLSQTIPGLNYSGVGVDGSGYIYVHGYRGDGSKTSDYGISVFDKDGNNIIEFATGINVSKFAVDYWRNLYTQAFVPVQQSSGGNYISKKSGVAQPAVSIWIPNTPNAPNPSPSASGSASASPTLPLHFG